jgi:predicted nucleic acid-binding protein
MSDRFFVDTNILVYAHDATAGDKHDRARSLVEQLWADRSGVLSTQVLQEFYINIRKHARAPLAAAEARQWVADYLNWEVVVNDGHSIVEAIELEDRYQISFWDALIVQAANAAGAKVLYSEDLSHGQRYSHVTVENPLLTRA